MPRLSGSEESLAPHIIAIGAVEAGDEIILQGQLNKKGHVRRNWKARHFVLSSSHLTYFDESGGVKKGEYRLSPSVLVTSEGSVVGGADSGDAHPWSFEVRMFDRRGSDSNYLRIEAGDSESMAQWVAAIRSVCTNASELAEVAPRKNSSSSMFRRKNSKSDPASPSASPTPASGEPDLPVRKNSFTRFMRRDSKTDGAGSEQGDCGSERVQVLKRAWVANSMTEIEDICKTCSKEDAEWYAAALEILHLRQAVAVIKEATH
jgi:hypothetical protein